VVKNIKPFLEEAGIEFLLLTGGKKEANTASRKGTNYFYLFVFLGLSKTRLLKV